MSHTILQTIDNPAMSELIEKKSRFIGLAAHISTSDELSSYLIRLKERHTDARHITFAAIYHDCQRLIERMSDDGEPSGTAGKPILEVLRRTQITDCVVIVVRYFGGILLGAGGLLRAYSTAASNALASATVVSLIPAIEFSVRTNYSHIKTLNTLINTCHAIKKDQIYSDVVITDIVVPEDSFADIHNAIKNAFNGSITIDAVNSTVLSVQK